MISQKQREIMLDMMGRAKKNLARCGKLIPVSILIYDGGISVIGHPFTNLTVKYASLGVVSMMAKVRNAEAVFVLSDCWKARATGKGKLRPARSYKNKKEVIAGQLIGPDGSVLASVEIPYSRIGKKKPKYRFGRLKVIFPTPKKPITQEMIPGWRVH